MDSKNPIWGHQMNYYLVLFYTVCYLVTSVDSPGTRGKEKRGKNANCRVPTAKAVKLCAENGAGRSREIT